MNNPKTVFQGIRYQVVQWEQKQFDDSYKTFEKIIGEDSTTLIATTSDMKIMIQKQLQPHWENHMYCMPGGMLEESEDPLEGAKRELLEESGYTSDEFELFEKYKAGGVIKNDYIFIAKNCKYIQKPHLDAGEDIETIFYSYEEFIELIRSNDNFRNINLGFKMLKIFLDEKKREEFLKKIF